MYPQQSNKMRKIHVSGGKRRPKEKNPDYLLTRNRRRQVHYTVQLGSWAAYGSVKAAAAALQQRDARLLWHALSSADVIWWAREEGDSAQGAADAP